MNATDYRWVIGRIGTDLYLTTHMHDDPLLINERPLIGEPRDYVSFKGKQKCENGERVIFRAGEGFHPRLLALYERTT